MSENVSKSKFSEIDSDSQWEVEYPGIRMGISWKKKEAVNSWLIFVLLGSLCSVTNFFVNYIFFAGNRQESANDSSLLRSRREQLYLRPACPGNAILWTPQKHVFWRKYGAEIIKPSFVIYHVRSSWLIPLEFLQASSCLYHSVEKVSYPSVFFCSWVPLLS